MHFWWRTIFPREGCLHYWVSFVLACLSSTVPWCCLDSDEDSGGTGPPGESRPPPSPQRQRQVALPGGHHQGGAADPTCGPSFHPPRGPQWHQVHTPRLPIIPCNPLSSPFQPPHIFSHQKLSDGKRAHVFPALGISQWGKELALSSTFGLCTMMRKNGRTQRSSTPVSGSEILLLPKSTLDIWFLVSFIF